MKLKALIKSRRDLREDVFTGDLEDLLLRFGSTSVETGVFVFEEKADRWLQIEIRHGEPRRLVLAGDGRLGHWADLHEVTRMQMVPAIRLFAGCRDEEVLRLFRFQERELAVWMSEVEIDAHFDQLERPWWKFW